MPKSVPFYVIALSIAAVVGVALLMFGCGSSSSNSLTRAQAQAVAGAVSSSISQSLQQAFGVASAKTKVGVTGLKESPPRASTPTCTLSPSGGTFNCTLAQTVSCSGGGTIAVSGDITGTLNNSGTGSVQEQIAATPANCSVDGLVINGDPQVDVAGQINISNGMIVFPVTGSETGGVTFGPKPSGRCMLNVMFTVNSNLTCTTTGTACGQPVSGSC
jgi:hypothetical protein